MEADKDAKETKREYKEEEMPSTSGTVRPDETEEKGKEEEQPVVKRVKSEREVCAGPSTAAVSEGEPSCSHHLDAEMLLQIITGLGDEMTHTCAAHIAALTNGIQEYAAKIIKLLESSHQPETLIQVNQLLSTMADLIRQTMANIQHEETNFVSGAIDYIFDYIKHKVGPMLVGDSKAELVEHLLRDARRRLLLVFPTIDFNRDGDDDKENDSSEFNFILTYFKLL